MTCGSEAIVPNEQKHIDESILVKEDPVNFKSFGGTCFECDPTKTDAKIIAKIVCGESKCRRPALPVNIKYSGEDCLSCMDGEPDDPRPVMTWSHCDCIMCIPCAKVYLRSQIESKHVIPNRGRVSIPCAIPGHQMSFLTERATAYLAGETMYNTLKALQTEVGAVRQGGCYCQNPQCAHLIGGPLEGKVTCPECETNFCTLCRNLSDNCTCGINPPFSDLFTPCPECKTKIEKTEGCNHMKCTECRCQFWYGCGCLYLGRDDYRAPPCIHRTSFWSLRGAPDQRVPEDAEQPQ